MVGRDHSRRELLALLAGSGAATLAGCGSALSSLPSERTADGSLTVGPSTAGLTDDEREAYADRMAEKYGSAATDGITSEDVPVPGGQPGLQAGTLLWDGTESLAVTDSSDETVAESDNYAALYEAGASADAEYYIYWLWSAARPRETNDWSGKLRNLWTHVDLTNEGDVTVYAPSGDVEDNGTVGPHPEKTGQDTDEFAVRWEGEYDEVQVVTGACTEQRENGERGFDWNVHLAASTR